LKSVSLPHYTKTEINHFIHVKGKVMEHFPFTDNTVIVTGASAGIGRQLALQLASQGARLALAARSVDKLEGIAEQCRQRGAHVLAVPTDVAQQQQCRNLIEEAVKEYGSIDTLINNAGISMWARFEEIENLALLENIMRVNYFGSMYCTYYALSYLKKSRGRIVGISSLTGKAGVPTRTGYAASKHAMAGFFDSLRIELANYGVSVTMIYPGFVATEVRKRAWGADGKPLEGSPLNETEVMTPESCAKLILKAAAQRKRELVMTRRGRIGLWLKLIAPRLVDRMASKAIETR
jgi:short-subunit dehydrogenase